MCDLTARLAEKARQKIVQIFKDNDLKITSTANLSQVQFLDITLDLKKEVFKPYIKPGDKPIYVHSKSNHPPSIIKNIPLAINNRLSKISANEEIFQSAAPLYQAELDKNGYHHKLEFDPPVPQGKKRNRNKNVIYFNPPYSVNVKTKIGQKFLKLVDKHFPPGSPLHPLLNRKKVKMSYRCLPNIKMHMAKHNSKLLNVSDQTDQNENDESCNCKNPAQCPLPDKCRVRNVVYQSTISVPRSREYYVGLTSRALKTRVGEHRGDWTHLDRKHKSTLASHVWNLKEGGQDPDISWKIICKAAPYSPITETCNLCTSEKWNIIFKPKTATLNSRQELFNHCRHKRMSLLSLQKEK